MTDSKAILVFIGTYPPRECGIATFTKDLLKFSQKLLSPHVTCKVAALNISALDRYEYPDEVFYQIDQNNIKHYQELAQKLNASPQVVGVILQHEYGIFGGEDGENVLHLIENLKKPLAVTLHTILPNPSPHFHQITQRIILGAQKVVVLTQKSKEILSQYFPESISKTEVIMHGIHPTQFSSPKAYKKRLGYQNNLVLSTFGLLSRGKGIEYVIQALPAVVAVYPSLQYLIIGETHPVVRRQEGELYRNELINLVNQLHLNDNVKFYDQYLNLIDLQNYLKASDVYISSSINPDQAVSGTLSYALGSGRAVISTDFPQARELVTTKVGRLVKIKDSESISQAILELLKCPVQLEQMHYSAYEITRPMLWQNIAREYLQLLNIPILPPLVFVHFKQMTDKFGLFQFSNMGVPNPDFGYTLDDNARALIIASWLQDQTLVDFFLNFVQACQKSDGLFVNYIAFDEKRATIQNGQEDLEESFSRAIWSLCEVMSNLQLSMHSRIQAQNIFIKSYPQIKKLSHLRALALIVKSLVKINKLLPNLQAENIEIIKHLANSLLESLTHNSDPSWLWFEKHLGYNNAILPEGLIVAGDFLGQKAILDKGIASLEFLISVTFKHNMYLPIGHSQWYHKDQSRSYFDQQPEDPASTILALSTTYSITHDLRYLELTKTCFSWYLGHNSLKIPLYNYDTGSCYDGLHPDRQNLNQGAESLVSYLLSRLTMEKLLNNSPNLFLVKQNSI